jgi:hypothetical protein
MKSDLMKISSETHVHRICFARALQSFAFPIPLVFLPYKSKKALEKSEK